MFQIYVTLYPYILFVVTNGMSFQRRLIHQPPYFTFYYNDLSLDLNEGSVLLSVYCQKRTNKEGFCPIEISCNRIPN